MISLWNFLLKCCLFTFNQFRDLTYWSPNDSEHQLIDFPLEWRVFSGFYKKLSMIDSKKFICRGSPNFFLYTEVLLQRSIYPQLAASFPRINHRLFWYLLVFILQSLSQYRCKYCFLSQKHLLHSQRDLAAPSFLILVANLSLSFQRVVFIWPSSLYRVCTMKSYCSWCWKMTFPPPSPSHS